MNWNAFKNVSQTLIVVQLLFSLISKKIVCFTITILLKEKNLIGFLIKSKVFYFKIDIKYIYIIKLI